VWDLRYWARQALHSLAQLALCTSMLWTVRRSSPMLPGIFLPFHTCAHVSRVWCCAHAAGATYVAVAAHLPWVCPVANGATRAVCAGDAMGGRQAIKVVLFHHTCTQLTENLFFPRLHLSAAQIAQRAAGCSPWKPFHLVYPVTSRCWPATKWAAVI
jgi:hypothetical protein